MTIQRPQSLPECLEPHCGAALTRAAADRNEGYCTPHLVNHPDVWKRVRDRDRADAAARAAAARERAIQRRDEALERENLRQLRAQWNARLEHRRRLR